MTGDTDGGRGEPMASLFAVFENPAAGRRRLPRLVGLLDDEEETVRVGAAWATCHVASELPDTAAYLAHRLADRLADEAAGLEAELVFGFLAARYPDVVAAELDSIEAEAANRRRFRSIQGSLARASYHSPEGGSRNVGRTSTPADASASGPRQVYGDDETGRDRLDVRRKREAGESVSDAGERVDADDSVGDSADEDVGDDRANGAGRPGTVDGTGTEPAREDGWQPADELPSLAHQSRFDRLTVLAKRRRGRYADVYRTVGTMDGKQYPVGVALFHRPDDGRESFASAVVEELGRWAGVCDHENVVTLYDWGVDPRPWAATEYVDQRLADRDGFGLEEAVWNASELADAVEHVHERGVAHGGIDPGNVVYYSNGLEADEHQTPLLTNVGLLHVVRRYFDPTTRLDPRYAAPEYFDRRYGRIDHATDVYHLGAVLYRLVTGRPPYDGEYERIRERVLNDPPPRPGDVADVPDCIDDVVTKAMARQKLRRYETVSHFKQDLRDGGANR